MPKNKVKFNLRNVHYAVASFDAIGNPTYGNPVAIPGAVSLALSANGEPSVFYADGYDYYTISNNLGYEGDLTIALIPDSFRLDVLGDTRDSNGVLIENADAPTVYFALMFEFDGDQKKIRHVMYKCTATRPSIESQTKEESIEVQTETLSLKATGLPNGKVKARTSDTTSQSAYEGWYESVYMPDADTEDTTLSALTIGGLALSPAFDPDTTYYTVTTANATNAVTATANDEDATVAILVNGASHTSGQAATWNEGTNTVVITVTNGEATRAYTVVVTKSGE